MTAWVPATGRPSWGRDGAMAVVVTSLTAALTGHGCALADRLPTALAARTLAALAREVAMANPQLMNAT